MYEWTRWIDHVTNPNNLFRYVDNGDGTVNLTPAGEVIQQGTPQDQTHFQNLENGVVDAETAAAMLLNAVRQLGWDLDAVNAWIAEHAEIETGVITLTNTDTYPFNNSATFVPLDTARPNNRYHVQAFVDVESAEGSVGDIVVSKKQTTGFQIAYTGSATRAFVVYTVSA